MDLKSLKNLTWFQNGWWCFAFYENPQTAVQCVHWQYSEKQSIYYFSLLKLDWDLQWHNFGLYFCNSIYDIQEYINCLNIIIEMYNYKLYMIGIVYISTSEVNYMQILY